MRSGLFEEQRAAMKGIFADVTASDPRAFEADGIMVTARPEPAAWPFTAMIVGFGTGIVVCVEERYLAWAREHAKTTPQRVNYLAMPLTAEAAKRGEDVHPVPPLIGFALSRKPSVSGVPEGYRLERVEKGWMDEWQARDAFTNALGMSAQVHRRFRNHFAYALFDGSGAPAAVSGAYATAALSEIGVDVAPTHRGRGLAPIVVSAVAADLLAEAKTPFYECEVRNVASQHTALASGFMPVCTVSVVMAAGMGLE